MGRDQIVMTELNRGAWFFHRDKTSNVKYGEVSFGGKRDLELAHMTKN